MVTKNVKTGEMPILVWQAPGTGLKQEFTVLGMIGNQ